jgi:hypothetical protein
MDVNAPNLYNDNNYYTIGDQPYLFWVSFGHNVHVDGRSVWATHISIQIEGDDVGDSDSPSKSYDADDIYKSLGAEQVVSLSLV